ncbi:molybdenum cofactor guanylyltransferase MobA [Pseudomonadota bacterium]
MDALQDTTGLVLAGGAGRRVGGVDKGLVPWKGKPLVEHVVHRMRTEVATLLISCNRNSDYYAPLADNIVNDQRHGFPGPLAGIEAAIPLLETEFLLISPCDTPCLPDDLGARLLAALDGPGASFNISYAHDGERGQYLCAVLRRRVVHTLTAALDSGVRAVHLWYRQHRCVAVDFSHQRTRFHNINRLGDA